MREAAISLAINGVLSLVFFLAVYGTDQGRLSWAAPDRLALDFVPQSIAVSLMSALVPALMTRLRVGGSLALRAILVRGALFAVAGGALGGLIAVSINSTAAASISWQAALIIKAFYGGMLGATITALALRRL